MNTYDDCEPSLTGGLTEGEHRGCCVSLRTTERKEGKRTRGATAPIQGEAANNNMRAALMEACSSAHKRAGNSAKCQQFRRRDVC